MNAETISAFQLTGRNTGDRSVELPLGEKRALQSASEAFHALADTMPQLVWSTLPDGSHDYYNARWYQFTGAPVGSTDGEGWAGMFHEEDQPKAWEKWNHCLKTGEPYEVEYRLRHRSGEYRWMLGRAYPIVDADGVIQRWIGTCTDIQDQKRVALENEILSQELSHLTYLLLDAHVSTGNSLVAATSHSRLRLMISKAASPRRSSLATTVSRGIHSL